MAYFQFYSRETGTEMKLAEVDDAICAYAGQIPDPDTCSMAYNIVVEVGFAMLLNRGGSHVTPTVMDEYLKEKLEGQISTHAMKLLRWAHIQQWEMHAWR